MKHSEDVEKQRIYKFVSGNKFFLFVVGVFIFQSLWIALSSRYAMAFDEDFHFGLIKLYADHLSPFWAHQPAGADMYGALYRDPSYLYHYLMSFPYHVIAFFTSNQTIQVLFLRFINIALFASSLFIFRKLLRYTKASSAVIHIALLLFVLIPIVPLLAAQINYDNVLMPTTALLLLLSIRLVQSIKQHKQIDVKVLLLLAIVSAFGCLVKYAFLPIVLGAGMFITVSAVRHMPSVNAFFRSLRESYSTIPKNTALVLIGLTIVSMGLLFQRYGLNMLQYHDPVPGCDKVLSVQQCSKYGPWKRDYTLAQQRSANPDVSTSPNKYMSEWLYGMWFRSYFAVAGPSQQFQTRGPFIIPAYVGPAALLLGLAAALVTIKRIKRTYNSQTLFLLLVTSLTYITVLWLDEYEAYTRTGQPVAINGRYLLPVAIQLIVFAILGFNMLLGKRSELKYALVILVVGSSLFGGGALTYILRSNNAWYWDSAIVRSGNHSVQALFGPITPGYKNTVQFVR